MALTETVKLSPEAKEELRDYRDDRNHSSFDSAVRELLDEVKRGQD